MVITYRRAGGLFLLITLAVAAVAATVITVVVAGVLLIVAASVAAVAAVAVFGRALLPRRLRRPPAPAMTAWTGETIETTTVKERSRPSE